MKNGNEKTEKEKFVEDYVKVMTAGFGESPEKEDEAIERAIREVWDRRRREKETKQKQARKK